ncbi:MAG TPA: hypothetical protein VMS17_33850 [Gemmataceae bacterium]|nr:hypothetical protein [Gemmataceae bacterium]
MSDESLRLPASLRRDYAERLDRDAHQLEDACRLETAKPEHLARSAYRVVLHACRTALAAIELGALPCPSSLRILLGPERLDRRNDSKVYGAWRLWVAPLIRGAQPDLCMHDAGTYDFPAPKTDARGHVLGRDGHPLRVVVVFEDGREIDVTDKTPAERREVLQWGHVARVECPGEAALHTDDHDDADRLSYLRQLVLDSAGTCRAAANLLMEGEAPASRGRQIDNKKDKQDNRKHPVSPRAPRLKLPSSWVWAIGQVAPLRDQTILQGEHDPYAREQMRTLKKLASALLSPARTLSDLTTPLSARHALVMFRPALDALASGLTQEFGGHHEGFQGEVQAPCNYPMAWQTVIMRLAEAVQAIQDWDAKQTQRPSLDPLPSVLLKSLEDVISELQRAVVEGCEPPAPAALPDGAFGTDGFRYRMVEVRFGRAAKQRALVLALWDEKNHRPRDPRPVQDVLDAVYGEDHDTDDAAFRQLCTDTRTRFEKSAMPLTIQTLQGRVQLTPCPL